MEEEGYNNLSEILGSLNSVLGEMIFLLRMKTDGTEEYKIRRSVPVNLPEFL